MSPSDEVDDTILKQYSGEKSSDWWADRIEDEEKSCLGCANWIYYGLKNNLITNYI